MAKSKDSYWFRHDSTSGRGLRLKKLQHLYDHWGKGVYWDIIEVLREQSGYKYEYSEMGLHLLADLIGVKDQQKFKFFIEKCVELSLFKIKTGFFYSETLINNMKSWETKKTNGSKGGRPKKGELKNLNETESKSEPKANSNHKRREDNSIKEDISLKSAGTFLRVGIQTILQSPSEYFKSANSITFENWKMKNPHDASFIPKVFERMDQEYLGYDFTDDNHVKKTFFFLLRDIKGSPAKRPLIDAPKVSKSPSTYNPNA